MPTEGRRLLGTGWEGLFQECALKWHFLLIVLVVPLVGEILSVCAVHWLSVCGQELSVSIEQIPFNFSMPCTTSFKASKRASSSRGFPSLRLCFFRSALRRFFDDRLLGIRELFIKTSSCAEHIKMFMLATNFLRNQAPTDGICTWEKWWWGVKSD